MDRLRTLRRCLSLILLCGTAANAGGPAPMGDAPSSDQALTMLREGNARFVSGQIQRPNADAARRAEIAGGQQPFAILLSCSDSRVPVELAFDRGIGDLFVIRVAGNVADTDEIGTIEYGVGHLHSPLVVVMGHSACGAVKAVASGAEVHGSIPGLVDNIIPAVEWVKKTRPDLKGDDLVNAAIEANVWQSIDDLVTRSSEVADHLKEGKIKVVGAVYDIPSGRVRWLGEHPYQDKLLSASSRAIAPMPGHDEAHAEPMKSNADPMAGHNAPENHGAAPAHPHDADAPASHPAPAKKTAEAHEDTHDAPHR